MYKVLVMYLMIISDVPEYAMICLSYKNINKQGLSIVHR